MIDPESEEAGVETSGIASFIDIMSSITLIFILMLSLVLLFLYKKSINERVLERSYVTAIKYKILADSLLAEIERRKVTKIIIPNELEGKVFFESGSAIIRSEFLPTLSNFFSIVDDSLKSGRYNLVQVEGHTDDVPIKTVLYRDNWDLGAARAIEVVRYLQSMGIPPQFLSATTHSEYKPFTKAATEDDRSQNRRIELVLLKK